MSFEGGREFLGRVADDVQVQEMLGVPFCNVTVGSDPEAGPTPSLRSVF